MIIFARQMDSAPVGPLQGHRGMIPRDHAPNWVWICNRACI